MNDFVLRPAVRSLAWNWKVAPAPVDAIRSLGFLGKAGDCIVLADPANNTNEHKKTKDGKANPDGSK